MVHGAGQTAMPRIEALASQPKPSPQTPILGPQRAPGTVKGPASFRPGAPGGLSLVVQEQEMYPLPPSLAQIAPLLSR